MSKHGEAIRQALSEIGGRATINELAFATCLPLPTIRSHLELNSTRDAVTGEWIDLYAWEYVAMDGHKVPIYWLTGNGAL